MSVATIKARAQTWARTIKRDVIALWIAGRDSRVPWSAKLVAACVAAYALSPIDLIPDAIPVLGLLDDIILVPLGIMLAIRMIPPTLMAEFRAAALARAGRPGSTAGLIIVVTIWIASAIWIGWLAWRHFTS